jgi:hypothetical protein
MDSATSSLVTASADLAAAPAQDWLQLAAMLACVTAAVAWLTARWLIRRRSGCAGDCSRCVAHGTATTPGPRACSRDDHGIRPAGLRVLQGPGSANLPPPGHV